MSSLISPCLIQSLQTARRVTVLTGAGISAESGVPTFRDAQTGLWAHYNPEDLATPQAFRRNPQLVWAWYAWRRELVTGVVPNAGHYALVELEQRFPEFTLITQNVDGLHRRAGSAHVIELHGNLLRSKCLEEGVVVEDGAQTGQRPPRCPHCGAWLRPDVVWFGEMLPPLALQEAEAAAGDCDIFFSIGTSAQVYPAAGLALMALHSGAMVVEINPQPTALSKLASFSLRGAAGTLLPALLRAIKAH